MNEQVKIISATQLSAICRDMNFARVGEITAAINDTIVKYNMPYGAVPEWVANIAHESGEFSIKSESLNYTTPQRIVDVWPSRFNLTGDGGKKNANDYIRNAQKLANEVYNGRMGNRNGSSDGYNFKGGGFAQITGRDAYTLYTLFVNKRDQSKRTIEEVACLVQTDDKWAMDSAGWFFCEFKNLEQLALQDNFRELVKRWNGGFIGIEEREKYYSRAVAVLK